MQFGLHSVNLHTCGYPETAARLARAAEAAGFESLWVADYAVLLDPPLPQRPMALHHAAARSGGDANVLALLPAYRLLMGVIVLHNGIPWYLPSNSPHWMCYPMVG